MAAYLSLRSKRSGSTPVELSAHSWLSPGLLESIFGAPSFDPLFASSMDQSPVKVGQRETERVFPLDFQVNDTTHDGLVGQLTTLAAMVVDVQRYGGWIRFRPNGGYAVEFEVQHVASSDWWSNLAEVKFKQRVKLTFTCSPYALGDPYDFSDTFATDTFGTGGQFNNGGADWTVSSVDTVSNPSVTGGALVSAASVGAGAWVHTGTQNRYGDVQVTVRMKAASYGTGHGSGVFLKYIDASNYIRVFAQSTSGSTTGTIQCVTCVAGVSNTRSTEAITLPAAGTFFWLTARQEGNTIFVEYNTSLKKPGITDTPTVSEATPYVLTTAEAAVFGSGINGQVGVVWTYTDGGVISYDEFEVLAFCYRGYTMPDSIPLRGAILGNVDALGAITYSKVTGGTHPWWMSFCPIQRVRNHSLVYNGDFDVLLTTTGWVATAVAGVTAAATSIGRVTTDAYEGDSCAQIVCPNTTDTGASFLIRKKFRKGISYTAEFYCRAASLTNQARVKLGVSGDIASGTASALSSTWTIRTVTWTPTADSEFAYVVAGVLTPSAIQTWQIDRVQVYEGTTAPTYWRGGEPALGMLQAENAVGAAAGAVVSAGYLGGQTVDGTDPGGSWKIVTGDLKPDPHSELVAVEVVVLIALPSTIATTATMVAYATNAVNASGAPKTYSVPHGSVGKNVGQFRPSAGTCRRLISLGTLYLRPNTLDGRATLNVGFGTTGGAVTSKLDAVFLFRSNQLCHTMGGAAVADTSYFLQSAAASQSKRVDENLSTTVWYSSVTSPELDKPRSSPMFGARIRVPSGNAGELMVLGSDVILDGTDSTTTDATVSYSDSVQLSVRPRYLMTQENGV